MSLEEIRDPPQRAGHATFKGLKAAWNEGLDELFKARRSSAPPWNAMLFHCEQETVLYEAEGGEPVGRIGHGGDPEQSSSFEASAGRLTRKSNEVLVRLAPELVFEHVLRIPAGARDVAEAIVRNQIERISPWPEAETVYGYRVMGGDRSPAATIEVRIAATSIAVLEAAVARARSLNFTPYAVDSAPAAAGEGIVLKNLRPDRDETRVRTVNRILAVALALSLFACGAGIYASWDRMARLDAVSADLAEINRRIDDADARVRESSQSQANRLAILRRKIGEPAVMNLVETLSRALPDDAHLTDLTFQGQQARLYGRAVDATSLIATLEGTGEFENVTFSAPTVRERGTNLETFSIVATARVRVNGSGAP